MQLTGVEGELWVGSQRAARITQWILTQPLDPDQLNDTTATVTGKVTWVDRFWSTQSPLQLKLWMGDNQGKGSWWVWGTLHIHQPIAAGVMVEGTVKGNPTATI